MRKGMLGLIVAIIVIVIFFFGAPFFMGIWVEKSYPRLIAKLTNHSNMKIKVLNYQRGWFHSVAKIEVNVASPWLAWPNSGNASAAPAATFEVTEHIWHGLAILAPADRRAPRLMLARAFFITDIKNPNVTLQSSSIWNLGGGLSTYLNGGDMQFGNQKQHIQISNLQGVTHVNASKDVKKINIRADMLTDIRVNPASPMQISLQKLHFQGDFHTKDMLWYGYRQLTADQLTVTKPNQQPISLTQIFARVKQTAKKDTTNILVDVKAAQLTQENLSVSPIALTLQVNNLNSAALTQLVQQTAQTEEQNLSTPEIVAQLYTPLFNVLTKGFSVNVKSLAFNTPQGPVNFAVNLQFPVQSTDPSVQVLVKDSQLTAQLQLPRDWFLSQLSHYYQNKQLSAAPASAPAAVTPATAAQETPLSTAQLQLNKWINDRWFVVNGNTLTLNIQYQKGQIYLNGQPFHFNSNNLP